MAQAYSCFHSKLRFKGAQWQGEKHILYVFTCTAHPRIQEYSNKTNFVWKTDFGMHKITFSIGKSKGIPPIFMNSLDMERVQWYQFQPKKYNKMYLTDLCCLSPICFSILRAPVPINGRDGWKTWFPSGVSVCSFPLFAERKLRLSIWRFCEQSVKSQSLILKSQMLYFSTREKGMRMKHLRSKGSGGRQWDFVGRVFTPRVPRTHQTLHWACAEPALYASHGSAGVKAGTDAWPSSEWDNTQSVHTTCIKVYEVLYVNCGTESQSDNTGDDP